MVRCTRKSVDPGKTEIKSYFQIVIIVSFDSIRRYFSASQNDPGRTPAKQKRWSCTS